MRSSVLVTGGAGFIGSHLSERLLSQGCEVVVVDNFNDYYDPAIKEGNIAALLPQDRFRLVRGDIRDPVVLEKLFAKSCPGAVVHLAAMAGVRPSITRPDLYYDVNILGTIRLLEAAVKHGVENFLFGSSSSVYGVHDKVPFSESDTLNRPVSPYAASKLAGEQLCFTYSHLYGLPVTCLRFFTVYGPRQRPEMAIHKFTRAILNGDAIDVYGDGTSRRDYTYIDDIINGVVASLERPYPYEVFNLGESRTVELSSLISLIEEKTGASAVKSNLPDQPGDVPVTFADINKARRLLDYDPKVPIEVGIERFVDWFRA